MNTFYKILYLVLLGVLVQSCKEDHLDLYNQEESGAAIYFQSAYSTNTSYMPFSFGYLASNIQDSIIQIPVAVTGNLKDYDRPFAIRIDSTTMTAGVHYDIVGTPMVRANRIVDTLKIKLHRTADIQEKGVDLFFSLVENEYFHTNIPFRYISGTIYPLLDYHLYLDDIADVPYLWTTFSGKSLILTYWGSYSKVKVDLMLQVLKVDPGYFYNPAYKLSVQQLMNWGNYMKYWLSTEKAAGRVYYDENGKVIDMIN